jgi:hypothetical protein
MRFGTACAAAVLLVPCAASAAELPVASPHHHQVTIHHVHRLHGHGPHFGYYFGRWGWRWGGSANSWYGSTFALADGPWDGSRIVLKASPKGIAAIHCTDRPDACLGEPVVVPVAVAEPWVGR